MDLQLQNQFFKEFQQKVFYDRHFKELKTREDGRQFQQSRRSDVILNSLSNVDGNCIIKKGKMLITCQIKSKFQEIFINVLRNKPQTSLINIQVSIPENKLLTNYQKKKKESYISQVILQNLNNLQLEQQLLTKHKFRTFGHKFQINIRALSQDGNLLSHCLIAAQLALQTTKIRVLQVQGDQLKQSKNIKILDLNRFIFPLVVSNVNNQILVDPSEQQEKVQKYSIINFIDIIGNNHQTIKQGSQQIQYQVLMKFQEQILDQRTNILSQFNIKDIITKMNNQPNQIINIQLKI